MKTAPGILRRVWPADAFSPAAFGVRALLLSALYGASELAGLRQYTTFLSGTSANLNVSWQTASTLGTIHLLLHLAFLVVVPAALIAAGLLLIWDRRPRRAKPSAPRPG